MSIMSDKKESEAAIIGLGFLMGSEYTTFACDFYPCSRDNLSIVFSCQYNSLQQDPRSKPLFSDNSFLNLCAKDEYNWSSCDSSLQTKKVFGCTR